jgi:hypothetical protein
MTRRVGILKKVVGRSALMLQPISAFMETLLAIDPHRKLFFGENDEIAEPGQPA